MIRRLLTVLTGFFIAAVLIIAYSCSEQDKLEYELYHVYSDKVETGKNIRIIALSDLHNKEFGSGNSELSAAVSRMEPDIIVIAGDMVNKDSEDSDTALELCEDLMEIAPVYYGFGNHESNLVYVDGNDYDDRLRELGINLLINDYETIDIDGVLVDIGSTAVGADEGEYQRHAADFVECFETADADTHVKVMISHFPTLYYDIMKDADFDLGICGHFHGGHIILPILGGLYADDGHKIDLFPEYCYGKFELKNCTIVVSRGLGNHELLPRINNRPEISVIDINSRPDG